MEGQSHDKKPNRESGDVFLLGGRDLEMYQSKKRLSRAGEDFIDKDLKWGAKIGDYDEEIQQLLREGKTPIAIELAGASEVEGVVDIDHHGDKSDRPASISQVMERIGKPMSFIDQLVAANDAGYIPGMERFFEEKREELESKYGKERFERVKGKLIDLIRAKDRQMQGVGKEDEVAAEKGIANAEKTASGTVVVRIPGDKWSAVSDRLFSTWPDGKENLIVVCDSVKKMQQVYFFGRGDVCKKMKEHFASQTSWGGGVGFGNENSSGFGGCLSDNPQEVIDFVTTNLLQYAN